MAQTPTGGHRDTQWVIQYRRDSETAKAGDIPAEEKLWTRHEMPPEVTLSGPAVRQALTNLRAGTFGLEWRAIRVETVQRVEGW